MEGRTAAAAPCYFTRVDLSDALGQRLIRLQKKREKMRESRDDHVSEWWDEGDPQAAENVRVSGQGEAEEEEEEEFVLSPAEQELAAQMAAMGLPTLLGGRIKNQARTSKTKTRRKAKTSASSTDSSSAPSGPLHASQTLLSSEPVATTGDSSPWQPVWDSEYGAFYWCNTETLESQWEVPDGSEAYAAALYAFGQEERSDAVFPAVEGGREVKRLGLRDAEKKGVEDSVNGGVFEVFKKEMQVDGTRTGKTGCETGAAHCKGHLDDMSPGTMGGGEKPKGRAEIGDGDIRHRNGTGGMGLLREGRSAADGLTGNHALSEGFEKATWEETRPVVQSFELRGRPRPCGTHVRFGDENDASGSGDENGALEYGSGNGALQNGSRNGALEDGSRNGALENGSRGARPVFRSEREEEVLDLMEVDDPMDVDSFGGVEKRGRSWIGQSAIGDAHVRMVGENRKVWVCEKTRVLDSGESSVPLVGRKSDVRELANAAERTPPLDAVADVSAAVRETAAAVRKMGTAVLEGTTGDGRERLTPATPHMAVRKSMSNGRGKAAAKGRTTGALEGGAFDRGETDGAGLDEERAAVLGDSLLEAAKERSHEGSETNAQLLADTSKVYGKHVKTTVGDGVKHGAEATVEVEASAQLDAERSDAPGSRALRNSLSQAAEGGELNRNLTPPLTSHQPSVDANREGPENGLTSAPESAAIADPEGGRAGVQSLTSVPGASDGRDSEAERASAVTSASAPEADAGAGGDAGCAALVASASGREKPADVGQKYWFQRYRLFSKFDQGVRLDPEGWYSVTPEAIAVHHAKRCARPVVIDAFAGVGGNAIQLATTADWVIAVDLDPGRLALAEHNAGVYGVRDKIEFVAGDFLRLAPQLSADALFLSPPWGGPEYSLVDTYDLDTMLEPVSGVELFKAALQVTSNIALFLPRNVDVKQLQELAWLASPPLPCEIESNYLCGKLKCITAYYGDLVVPPGHDR